MMPLLIIAMGLAGTGKSTLAKLLAKEMDNSVIHSSLQVKRDFGYQRFSDKRKDKIYGELKRRIEQSMREGKNIIIDRATCRKSARKEMLILAFLYNYPVLFLECCCSARTAKQRMKIRVKKDKLISDPRDPHTYLRMVRIWKPIEIIQYRKIYHRISYLQVDTEKQTIQKIAVELGLKPLIEKIAKSIERYWSDNN